MKLYSILLVPIVIASPDGWSSNKIVIFSSISLWIGSVFLVGTLSSHLSNPFLPHPKQKWPQQYKINKKPKYTPMKSTKKMLILLHSSSKKNFRQNALMIMIYFSEKLERGKKVTRRCEQASNSQLAHKSTIITTINILYH